MAFGSGPAVSGGERERSWDRLAVPASDTAESDKDASESPALVPSEEGRIVASRASLILLFVLPVEESLRWCFGPVPAPVEAASVLKAPLLREVKGLLEPSSSMG